MTGNRTFNFTKENGLYVEIIFNDYISHNIPYQKIVENGEEYKSFTVTIQYFKDWTKGKPLYKKQYKRIDRPFYTRDFSPFFKDHKGYIKYHQHITLVNVDFKEMFKKAGYNFNKKICN